MRWLEEQKLLKGEMLDYGCGRGFDAEYYHMDGYDPNWKKTEPSNLYDTITCNYVLNVVNEKEQERILNHIQELLEPNGTAYIAVRRDITYPSQPGRGCTIRYLVLPFLTIYGHRDYVIYKMEKGEQW